IPCRRPADAADKVTKIARDLGVGDEKVRAGDLLFSPLHLLPQTLLVALGRLIAGTDQRNHLLRPHARLGGARVERRGSRAAAEQQRASRQLEAPCAHQRFSGGCGVITLPLAASLPGFIRPSSRSIICAAPSGVLRSPKLMPGISLPAWTTLNQTTSPVFKSTSEA